MRFFLHFIVIILFALIIDLITVESLGYILEDIFSIPEKEMMNGIYWGDAFISRIIVSLLGTFIGGYIIGISINKKEKIATFIYALPILSFWIMGVIAYYYISELPHNFDNPKFSMLSRWKLIPLITSILTMPSAYLGCHYGSLNNKKYTRTYSILNVKWYNLIWVIPTLYSFAVAVLCMLFVSIFYSFWVGNNPLYNTFQVFFENQFIIELLSLFSLSVILMTSITIFKSTYKYLSDESIKVRYKNLKIFGSTIYFWILFAFTFNAPDIFAFSFETDSLLTNAAIPEDFSSAINLSIILFSGYLAEKSTVKLLRRNELMNRLFDLLKSYRKNFFNSFLKLFKRKKSG